MVVLRAEVVSSGVFVVVDGDVSVVGIGEGVTIGGLLSFVTTMISTETNVRVDISTPKMMKLVLTRLQCGLSRFGQWLEVRLLEIVTETIGTFRFIAPFKECSNPLRMNVKLPMTSKYRG